MARDPERGWESPQEEAPRERAAGLSSGDYRPSGGAVRRGGSPIWPLLLVLVLLGGIAFAAVTWLAHEPAPEGERVEAEPVEREAASVPAAEPAPAEPPPATDTVEPPRESEAAEGDAPPAVAKVEPPSETETAGLPPPATVETPKPPVVTPEPPRAEAPVTEGTMEGPMQVKEAPPAALAAALATLAEGESDEALAVVAEHAEAGWPEAQTALGLRLAQGDIIQRDFERALELFEAAAEQGDAAAQYYLGYAYLSGSGVEADPVTALAWFILAASRGHAEALTERDRGLATLSRDDRSRAFNLSRNLGPDLAAGWSRDPASGVAVWLPSWYRNGAYALRIEAPAENGYAHGAGRIVLKSSQPGSSDRTFEGQFVRGYFHGEQVHDGEVHFLETDDLLFRLPDSPEQEHEGIAFWLRVGYGVQIAADPCYVATNQRPDILVTVPDGFPLLDDAAIERAMREGWRIYQTLCPERYYADMYVLPTRFTRKPQKSRRISEFQPLIARASFYGERGEKLSVGQFQNEAREAHEKAEAEAERQRKRAEREEKRRQAAAAAKTRGNPDVRGLKLGMTLVEVRALFEDEIAEWNPPWQPNRPPPPFRQFEQSFRLTDGAKVSAGFTSPVNGSVLYAFSYEQRFRGGVDRAQLTADLEAKYGKPDDYGTGGIYWSYELESRKPKEVMGAFFKVTIRNFESGQGRIDFLRLVANDAGFGTYDERAARSAEVEEKRRQYEAGKSDKPRF